MRFVQAIFIIGAGLGGIKDLLDFPSLWASASSGEHPLGAAVAFLTLVVVLVRALLLLAAAAALFTGLRHGAHLAVLALSFSAGAIGYFLVAGLIQDRLSPGSFGASQAIPLGGLILWQAVWLLFFFRSQWVRARYGPVTWRGAFGLLRVGSAGAAAS
jgi:hypothetical protein